MNGRGLLSWRAWLLSAAIVAGSAAGAAGSMDAARVLVLANADDPDSLRLARHYAAARSVPAGNVLALPLSRQEEIAWPEFVRTLWEPLLARLVAEGWIDATPMSSLDPVGRRRYAPRGHRIAALVVCRGVPLKIPSDPALLADVVPLTRRAELRTNAGAVDSELSLLAEPNYPITALVSNPLYQSEHPGSLDLEKVVRVSRLDGPSLEDALGLVDQAIAGEKSGLIGRAYVDLAQRDRMGDGWLQAVADQWNAQDFEVQVDREPATMPVAARFDAPVLYAGWYASELNGPFTVPGFRFPPGAIALHIHSFSGASLRAGSRGWTAGFVARGVTATIGNVHEPYLQFTHRPDVLMRALARGASWGEAVYEALPALSWQAIAIGDPLYRPFAVGLETQRASRANLADADWAGVQLRRIHQLERRGQAAEALEVLETVQREQPSLAGGLALAERRLRQGDREGAGRALESAGKQAGFGPPEWGLAREVALALAAAGRARVACDVWKILLRAPGLPRETRLLWLPEAASVAAAAGEPALATSWNEERRLLESASR